MARQTVNGLINITFTRSTTGSSAWYRVPGTICNKISATATFSGTTGIIKLQGCVSTASTGTPTAVLQRTYAQRSTIIASTVATAIQFLRVNSTSLQAGQTVRLAVTSVP